MTLEEKQAFMNENKKNKTRKQLIETKTKENPSKPNIFSNFVSIFTKPNNNLGEKEE